MSLQDVTGVFSRYFIVGFFIPAFVALSFLKLVLSDAWLPTAVEPDKSGSFLVLGGAGLILGLVLLGLRDPILDVLSGYFLVRPRTGRLGGLVARGGHRLRARHVATFKTLREQAGPFLDLGHRSDEEREQARVDPELLRESARAAWRLDRCFPQTEAKVLPTSLGNRLRASEDYVRTRWSLEPEILRPRVESLLSDQEAKIHADADTDLGFFLNSALLVAAAGAFAAVDAVANQPHSLALSWVYALPFLAAAAFYRAAVSAAERQGALLRASFDLHRRELYETLGFRQPHSREEQIRVGRAANQFVMYGWDIPADLLTQKPDQSRGARP